MEEEEEVVKEAGVEGLETHTLSQTHTLTTALRLTHTHTHQNHR